MIRARDLILVGGGHTHVQVLRHFMMQPPAATRVTVVLDQPVAVYSGMVPGFAAGQYRIHELEIDVVPLARRAGARVVLSPATGVVPDEHRLEIEGRPPLCYDLLSLDVGSTVAGLDVPGVREHALPTRPIALLVHRLDEVIETARRSDRESYRVVVVGAGAGGVEMAFTLEHRLSRELERPVTVTLLDSSPQLLSGFHRRLGKRISQAAKTRGIEIQLERQVESISKRAVTLVSGGEIPADLVVWVTGAAPHPFLQHTPLAKDGRGFVATRPTLQTKEYDDIFAVGDCATIEATPTPKAGVYAVRQGPRLIANLEASLAGTRLDDYVPQKNFLTLLNLGGGTAVGAKGPLVFEGRVAMRLKDWIDRRFMRRFQVLDEAGAVSEDFDQAMDSGQPMLCGGCAAKLGQSALERALGRLEPGLHDPEVILGLDRPDDAAAFRTPRGDEVYTTVDAFRAFTDDPFLIGRVAALNAISDLEAKGIEPRFALALVTLPDPRFAMPGPAGANEPTWSPESSSEPAEEARAEETLFQVLSGAREIFDRGRVSLIGGHTTTGPELVVGFSVLGVRDSERAVMFKDGARPGDCLVLTKPLGTGVLLHADMLGQARGRWVENVFETMSAGNRRAAELALDHGASSATDITGFGLAGHLAEMVRSARPAAQLEATISLAALPALPGAIELLSSGLRSTSHAQNAQGRRGLLIASAASGHRALELLFDPQTAGGLLIAVAEKDANALCQALRLNGYPSASVIGSLSSSQSAPDSPDSPDPSPYPTLRIEP